MQLHTLRIRSGQLTESAERWWHEIGGSLRGGDPTVVDAWLDQDHDSFLLVVSHRSLEALEGLAQRSRHALPGMLKDLTILDLSPFHDRFAFAGEPAPSDPALPEPRPTQWERVEIGRDDQTLRIAYLRTAVSDLNHVEIRTDQWSVEVTVFLGYQRSFWTRLQHGEKIGYAAVGIKQWTQVVLDRPIGDRCLRDGAGEDQTSTR